MSVEQIVAVAENGQLTIRLPRSFKGSKKGNVMIDAIDKARESKLALLLQASNDPLFLADLEEVNKV